MVPAIPIAMPMPMPQVKPTRVRMISWPISCSEPCVSRMTINNSPLRTGGTERMMRRATGISQPPGVLNATSVSATALRAGGKHVLPHPVGSRLQSLEDLVLVDGQDHKDADDGELDELLPCDRASACSPETPIRKLRTDIFPLQEVFTGPR
jgi:hypothetical protein